MTDRPEEERFVKKIRFAVLAALFALLAVCTACNSSPTQSDESTPQSSATAPEASIAPAVPNEATVEAWSVRLDKISELVGAKDTVHTDDFAGYIHVGRDAAGQIDTVFIAGVTDHVDAFYHKGVITAVLYTINERRHSTHTCLSTEDDSDPTSTDCAVDDLESAERFVSTLPQFDTYAEILFGDAYQV